jgi:GTPase Era involved in 16S rRNA processing
MEARERLIELERNISAIINAMEQDVRANKLVPDNIFLPLLKKLRSLNKVMDPQRALICYLVGNTSTGKSSLINKICGRLVCRVSEDDGHGTENFSRIHVEEVNTTFIDTVGFGSDDEDAAVCNEIKSRFMESKELPDVILFIVTRENLRDQNALKWITSRLNNILKWLMKQQYQIEIPIVCVLNKIDDYFEGRAPQEQGDLERVEEHLTSALSKVNQHLCIEIKQRVAVSTRFNYHVDHLKTIMNVNSPLNAQIIENNHQYFLKYRQSMANTIITAFSTASAAISVVPLIDLLIITVMHGWMFKMLACFSVDSRRTPEMFERVNWTQNMLHSIARTALLLVGDAFELTGALFLIGAGISVTAASLTTAKLGWTCYEYFTKE